MHDEANEGSPTGRRARRWRHHLTLAAVTIGLGALVAMAHSRAGTRERLSLATGQLGFLFVAVALLLGPLNVLRRRANPVSTDLRRDVGIWGGVLALVHTVLGLGVHMKGKMAEYFLQPAGGRGLMPLRLDPFGLANDLGLIACLILVGLVAISSDYALGKLGRPRWKRWQQLTYVAAVATVAHGALFQVFEKRTIALVALFASATLVALVAQALGVRAVLTGSARRPR